MTTAQWASFNVNDKVQVKLTNKGRAIHRASYDKLMAALPERARWEYKPPEEDAEGWSAWTMWVLMQEFGPHVAMGVGNPFETEIRFQTKAGVGQ